MKYIIIIDQGTTSTRAIVYDRYGKVVSTAIEEFKQIYPKTEWVEHDPIDILSSVRSAISMALTKGRIKYSDLLSIGITNQRETVVMWDKETLEPVYNAIVWQCRRTKDRCQELKRLGYEAIINKKTGLKLDSYFSATKIEWLLKNVSTANELLKQNRLMVGTIDTFLMYFLSGGKIYKTDYTNASRTMLFNINELDWDKELCSVFNIPIEILPTAYPSCHNYGNTDKDVLGFEIPICSVAGDQQSALFGQCCFNKGDLKVTYGTGCFLLLNTLDEKINSNHGLITTLSCQTNSEPIFILEGSVFIGGALIQWLRDGLNIIKNAYETSSIAKSVPDTNGVYVVPAFVGLGAPYWNQDAEGMITGITRGTNQAHIIRASLEAIAFEVNDLIKAMEKDLKIDIKAINVDGGASQNDFLMQFQADISNANVHRPKDLEVTALGSYYLNCLCLGIYEDYDEIININKNINEYKSNMDEDLRLEKIKGWNKAIKKSMIN